MVPLGKRHAGDRDPVLPSVDVVVEVRAEGRSGASEELVEALIRQVRAPRVALTGVARDQRGYVAEIAASIGRRAHRTSGFVRQVRERCSGLLGGA
jgi:hypothetical protein